MACQLRSVVSTLNILIEKQTASVIAEVETATEGRQVPLAFSLDYDPARIDSRGRYAV